MPLDPFLRALVVRKIDIEEHKPSAAFNNLVVVFIKGVSDKHKQKQGRGRFFWFLRLRVRLAGDGRLGAHLLAVRLGDQTRIFHPGVRIEMNLCRASRTPPAISTSISTDPADCMRAGSACNNQFNQSRAFQID
jgi:hypothetical protein